MVLALAALCLVGCLSTGCGDDRPAAVDSIAQKAPDPNQRCSAAVPAKKVVLTTADGLKLAGARYGTGSHGVVLLPQSGSDMCGWSGFVPALVERGLQVLAIDPRCTGYSECPPGDDGEDLGGGRDYAADAGAAIEELHHTGAAKVAVMGASLGAATAFVAGGRYPDKVSAVVALSLFDASFSASQSGARSATEAAPHVTAPIMICLSTNDSNSIGKDAADALIAAAPSQAAGAVIALADGGHGWVLLLDETLKGKVLDFLAANT
jgi:pimeloyl-ACP methyl ester carboxylesterase